MRLSSAKLGKYEAVNDTRLLYDRCDCWWSVGGKEHLILRSDYCRRCGSCHNRSVVHEPLWAAVQAEKMASACGRSKAPIV